MREKFIFKSWPKIREADEPDNIEWDNLGVNFWNRKCRIWISSMISIFILILALGFMIGSEVAGDTVSNNFNVPYLCPLDAIKAGNITKDDVYKDF